MPYRPIRVSTIDQYKALVFVEQNFGIDYQQYFTVRLYDSRSVVVTDHEGASLIFKHDSGEILECEPGTSQPCRVWRDGRIIRDNR